MQNRKITSIFLTLFITMSCVATAIASTYIGNASSYKLHYADCRHVTRMNDYNKVYFENRDEAINAGYVPCKVCKP